MFGKHIYISSKLDSTISNVSFGQTTISFVFIKVY